MKQVAKSLSIPFVIMCTLVLLATLAVTPASAVEEDIDHEAAKELHDALQDAKEHGDPIVGDISEKALIKEIESKRQGLPGGLQQAGYMLRAAVNDGPEILRRSVRERHEQDLQ